MNNKTVLTVLIATIAFSSSAVIAEAIEEQKFYNTELLASTLTADDQEALQAAIETEQAASDAVVAAVEADADAAAAAEADAVAAAAAEADAIAAAAAEAGSPDAAELQAIADETDAEALQAIADETDAEALQAIADQTDANELQAVADAAAAELQVIQGDIDATIALIDELTEEQVFALNRSLNNAADEKLLIDIDAEDLQSVIDGDFNKLQINAFTQAFEQEARFLLKSEKFAAKYEETGDDKFLGHAARMEEKGAAQKSKFEGKIDRFTTSPSAIAGNLAKQTAKDTAKDAAKGAAKGIAKNAAKGAAKNAAKGAAKNAAKNAAKKAARNAAKNAAKKAARNAAKNS